MTSGSTAKRKKKKDAGARKEASLPSGREYDTPGLVVPSIQPRTLFLRCPDCQPLRPDPTPALIVGAGASAKLRGTAAN